MCAIDGTAAQPATPRIRPARPADDDAIAELFRGDLPEEQRGAWFQWKYREHPAPLDHPVHVARRDGRVVGAVGFVPIAMRTRTGTCEAVTPGNIAVRSDVGEGLHDELLRAGLKRYADNGASFAFDASTLNDSRGDVRIEWDGVGSHETFVRVHRPSAVRNSRLWELLEPVLRRGADTMTTIRQHVGVLRRSISRAPVDAIRTPGVPTSTLEAIYHDHPPQGRHAERTESFYDWRFANPLATYRTYVGYRHGTPIVAIVTERTTRREVTVTSLADIVPLESSEDHRSVRAGLVALVTADHADADLLVAPKTVLPRGMFERLGFLGDRRFPLSVFASDRQFVVTNLDRRNGPNELADPRGWSLSFTELDP